MIGTVELKCVFFLLLLEVNGINFSVSNLEVFKCISQILDFSFMSS